MPGEGFYSTRLREKAGNLGGNSWREILAGKNKAGTLGGKIYARTFSGKSTFIINTSAEIKLEI
jgi:predicted transcriptional regulator